MKLKTIVSSFMLMVLFSGLVNATYCTNNQTFCTLADLINDSRAIIAPITGLVIDLAPLLITLAIASFIIGLFSIILLAIKGKAKIW